MVTNGGGQSHTPAQSRKVVLRESELLQVADKHQFSLTLMDPLNLTGLGCGGVNCDPSRGISHAPNSSTEKVYFTRTQKKTRKCISVSEILGLIYKELVVIITT